MAFYPWVGFAHRGEKSDSFLPTDGKAEPQMQEMLTENGNFNRSQPDQRARPVRQAAGAANSDSIACSNSPYSKG